MFDETEVLDAEIQDMLNMRLIDIWSQCDGIITKNQTYLEDMKKRLAWFSLLQPEHFDFATMSIQEICNILKTCCEDVDVLWVCLEKSYSKAFFFPVIDKHF